MMYFGITVSDADNIWSKDTGGERRYDDIFRVIELRKMDASFIYPSNNNLPFKTCKLQQ